MSKCSINAPDAAIIIIGGAIIANIGGNAPVAPRALNVLIKKYIKKHVMIPKLNFKPKLKFRRWRVCEKAIPNVAIATIVNGKNNSVQNCTKCPRTGTPIADILCIKPGNSQNEIWFGCKYLSNTVLGVSFVFISHLPFVVLPFVSHIVAFFALNPSLDNLTDCVSIRFNNLKLLSWINIVASPNISVSFVLCISCADIVKKWLSVSSRIHIVLSTNCNSWSVMFFALTLTKYGFITVVANIPTKKAPNKNGRAIWYGDRPALDIIMASLDLVKLYIASNVPINTVNGKNIGIYSNKRTQASVIADIVSGFDGRRSTNVTA